MSSSSNAHPPLDRDFVVGHDGAVWHARQGPFSVSAATVDDLDRAVARWVRRQTPDSDLPVTVTLRFDTAALPAWMRQYAGHYFNRILHVDRQPAEETAHHG